MLMISQHVHVMGLRDVHRPDLRRVRIVAMQIPSERVGMGVVLTIRAVSKLAALPVEIAGAKHAAIAARIMRRRAAGTPRR
jgi:hypothetical protein